MAFQPAGGSQGFQCCWRCWAAGGKGGEQAWMSSCAYNVAEGFPCFCLFATFPSFVGESGKKLFTEFYLQNFFTLRVTEHWTGCPERLWILLLRRYSKPGWTWSCAACSRWPCFGGEVGLDDPQRSLPTPTVLGFCDRSVCSAAIFTVVTLWVNTVAVFLLVAPVNLWKWRYYFHLGNHKITKKICRGEDGELHHVCVIKQQYLR